MSGKEISAAVMVIGSIVISAWVVWEMTTAGMASTMSEAAWKMLWAIGFSIAFNIVAVIVGFIVVSIIQREAVKDERADERDKVIGRTAMASAYLVLSIGVLGVLICQALGMPANLTPYALFGISMLAGGSHAATQLVLYRMG